MNSYGHFEALSPIYRGGLTNHIPMLYGVYTLLGVDEDLFIPKLHAYQDEKGILDLTQPTTPVLEFEQDYIKLTSYFLREMGKKGKHEVVKDYLNKRIKSLHSALFHGVIRLYYALELDNDLMIAQALSYFELVNNPYNPSRIKFNQHDYLIKFEELRSKVEELNIEYPKKSTQGKFSYLMNHRLFKSSVMNLNYHDVNEHFILELITKRYLETNDFYCLHLITGFHAIYKLKEYFLDYHEVLRHYMNSMILFLMMNPTVKKFEFEENSIDYYINNILLFDDAHTVKLLYSVYDLHKDFPLHNLKEIANLITKQS